MSEDEQKAKLPTGPTYADPFPSEKKDHELKDEVLAYYAKKDGLQLPVGDPNVIAKEGMNNFLKKAYSKEVKAQELMAKSVDKWPLNSNRSAQEKMAAQQRALEKMAKLSKQAEEAAGRKLTPDELATVMHDIESGQVNAQAGVIRRLEERTAELEKALKEAGTRDPLLVATNEVLADENKRLTEEVERLTERSVELQRRLDEAHNRLYKTIDILQEASDRTTTQGPAGAPEEEGSQEEAQEVRGSHGGAEQAPGGSEHDTAGGQREAAEEGEGARGENSRSLTVVGGSRS